MICLLKGNNACRSIHTCTSITHVTTAVIPYLLRKIPQSTWGHHLSLAVDTDLCIYSRPPPSGGAGEFSPERHHLTAHPTVLPKHHAAATATMMPNGQELRGQADQLECLGLWTRQRTSDCHEQQPLSLIAMKGGGGTYVGSLVLRDRGDHPEDGRRLGILTD